MLNLGSRLLCSLLLVLILAGCARPVPPPQFPVSQNLHFPFVPVSNFQWHDNGGDSTERKSPR